MFRDLFVYHWPWYSRDGTIRYSLSFETRWEDFSTTDNLDQFKRSRSSSKLCCPNTLSRRLSCRNDERRSLPWLRPARRCTFATRIARHKRNVKLSQRCVTDENGYPKIPRASRGRAASRGQSHGMRAAFEKGRDKTRWDEMGRDEKGRNPIRNWHFCPNTGREETIQDVTIRFDSGRFELFLSRRDGTRRTTMLTKLID